MLSPKSAAQIGGVNEIYSELDYGDAKLPRCEAFYDDVRNFRKGFISFSGRPGTSFHEWKSQEHQLGLTEMTNSYLDRDGKGQQFWPDDATSPNYNNLQYSDDMPTIKSYVKQLFYKSNLQQHRNVKYKHKQKTVPEESNRLQHRGLSTDDPIDLDSENVNSRHGPSRSPTYMRQEPRNNPVYRAPIALMEPSPAPNGAAAGPSNIGEPTSDPFAIPQSREPSLAEGQSRFRLARPGSSRDDQEPLSQERPAKRAKKQHTPRKPQKQSTINREDGRSTKSKRTSARERHQRQDPTRATDEQVQAAVSPTLSSTPSPSQDHPTRGTNESGPSVTSRTVTLKIPSRQGAEDTPGQAIATESAITTASMQQPDEPTTASPDVPLDSVENGPYNGLPASVSFQPGGVAASHETPNATTSRLSQKRKATTAFSREIPMVSRETEQVLNITGSAVASSHDVEAHIETPSAATSTVVTTEDEQNERHKQEPKQGPIIQFVNRVVYSRKPSLECEEWTPQGGFRNLTLARLVEEIPLEFEGDSLGLLFTIKGPSLRMKFRVHHGRVQEFEAMKQSVEKLVRTCTSGLVGHDKVLDLLFELEMEVMKDESAAQDKMESHYEEQKVEFAW